MGKGHIDDKGEDKPCSTRAISQPIDLPIEGRDKAKGNPNAILHFDKPLNNRQQKLLNSLPECDSRIIVDKKNVNMKDLSALTAVTGDEFAMFTNKQNRLIVRGNATTVNITEEDAKQLYLDGYTWSGHTHPGVDETSLWVSKGDKLILKQFNQEQSVIYNSKGIFRIFNT